MFFCDSMASDSKLGDAAIESCTNCSDPLGKMVERKKLPCGHKLCSPCLAAGKDSKGNTACVICR